MPFSFLCSTLLFSLFLRLPVHILWNCFTCWVPKTPRPATLVWWDAWRTHRTHTSLYSWLRFTPAKAFEAEEQSKRCRVQSRGQRGEPGTNFQRPLPIESHRMCLIPPATELWHVWNVVYHKTLVKMQCQKQTNKNKRCSIREFPGSSLVRTPCFHYQQPGYSTWLGNWDPTSHTAGPKQCKTKKQAVPGLLLWTIHVGTSCIADIQILDSQEESMC